MTTQLSRAAAAWRKQPKRARQVALAIMRGEAFFALAEDGRRSRESAAMFNAAFALLKAAENTRKVRSKR